MTPATTPPSDGRTAPDTARAEAIHAGGVGVGVFASSLAIAALAVVLARLHSALFGSAYVTVPLGLPVVGSALGLALSAWFLGGRRSRPSVASTSAGLATVASVFSLIQTLRTKLGESEPATQWREFLFLMLLTVPVFVLKGLTLAAVVRKAPRAVLTADALGTAFGGLAGGLLLGLGAPRAGLVIAIIFGVSSVAFAVAATRDPALDVHARRAVGFRGAAFFLAGTMLLWGDYGERWLELPKARAVNLERAVLVRWTARGLVTVDRPSSAGYSMVAIDGNPKTAIHGKKTAPRLPEHALYLALAAEDDAPVAVLGAGSVRDVRAALLAGRTHVIAVEPDRALVGDVVRGVLARELEGILDQPEVEVVDVDPRVFVRMRAADLAAIVLPGVDANAGPSARGLPLDESLLYTREAVREYLAALTPEGYLVMRRWDPDLGRLLALVASVLGPDAKRHLYACSHTGSTALFVKRAPLTDADVERLRSGCTPRFIEVFSPDTDRDRGHEAKVARPAEVDTASKLGPPSDDRPSFYVRTSLDAALTSLRSPRALREGGPDEGLVALLLLGGLIAFVLALGARASRWVREATWGAPAGAWSLVGASWALCELGLLAGVTSYLGTQRLALSFVLPVLYGGLALGLHRGTRGPSARLALALAMGLAAAALLWDPLARATGGAFGLWRALIAAGVLGAVGFVRGALVRRLLVESASRDARGARGWLAFEGVGASLALVVGTLGLTYAGRALVVLLAGLTLFVGGALLVFARRRASPAS